jgi:amino acid transporter
MIRGLGLRGAVAVNTITMIGIGPLITIPLVLTQLHGSSALWAWVVGAFVALCDGLVWAELGSLYPGSGGTYVYLREAFGPRSLGRLLAFLFVWQIVFTAPLLLASGYIGFAQYAGFLSPALASHAVWRSCLAAAVAVVTVVVLYRPIGSIARTSVVLGGVAVVTLLAVIAAAFPHFDAALAFGAASHAGPVTAGGLGAALVITLYDYFGYGQANTVSDEVRRPAVTLPLAILIAIALVGSLYVALQVGVLGALPWQTLAAPTPDGQPPDAANYVASTVVAHAWGLWPAYAVTLLILVTAFASTYGNLLGYSRIPYAAAVDGTFLRPFARLHRAGRFPAVSLLVVGLLAIPASFLSLGQVITALTTGLVLIQSVAQIVAVFLIRRRGVRAPYRMWLYPLPAVFALIAWIYIFCSAGTFAIVFGCVTVVAGLVVYLVRARLQRDWPFAPEPAAVG